MWKKQPTTANDKCTKFPGQANRKRGTGFFEQRPGRCGKPKTLLNDLSAKNSTKPRAQILDFLVANHKQRTGRNYKPRTQKSSDQNPQNLKAWPGT